MMTCVFPFLKHTNYLTWTRLCSRCRWQEASYLAFLFSPHKLTCLRIFSSLKKTLGCGKSIQSSACFRQIQERLAGVKVIPMWSHQLSIHTIICTNMYDAVTVIYCITVVFLMQLDISPHVATLYSQLVAHFHLHGISYCQFVKTV